MRMLWFDLFDALRGLRRDRAYAAVVTGTLALTIGATTAVFSIVDGVLLKPLAYPMSERLVALSEVWHEFADRFPALPLNERHFEHWRRHATSFEAMAQYTTAPANLTGAGDAAEITVVRSSGSLFEVLGVQPTIGRTLTPGDEGLDRPDVVMLADSLWRERFGADPQVVGRSIVLDGRPYTVVGVLPGDFRLPAAARLLDDIDAVVPLRPTTGWLGEHNHVGLARLRDGVTLDQARAELLVLQAQVSEIVLAEAGERVTLSATLTPLATWVTGRAERGLWLLLAAVAAVLLIACSNLANLALSRAMARARDGAIRTALGASRWRVMRRSVLEHLVLALLGAAGGVWVASIALDVMVRTAPVDLPRLDQVGIDARVLAFSIAVALITGVLVALLPAWRVASNDVQTVLRSGGGAAGADRDGMRVRGALTALQVALSVTLLTTTALLTVSLFNVLRVDLGFRTERILSVPLALPTARYADEASRSAAFDRVLTSVSTIPGLRNASFTSLLPLRGEGQVNFVVPDGVSVPRSEQATANFRLVGPRFFETLDIALLRGRPFTEDERDPSRPTPAVVSAPLAERLWPGQDPIGRRFSRGIEGEGSFEVVGVAADARTTSVERTPPAMVYVPYWWQSRTSTTLLLETSVDPSRITNDVRRLVANIDPEIAVGQVSPLAALLDEALAARRYQTRLFLAFALAALFIANLGVFAVTSYNVTRRRREMNIRVALGAGRGRVLGLIVRQSGAPIALGVLVGMAGAVATGSLVSSLLYEVPPGEPVLVTAVASLVGLFGVVTAALAGRRSLSIEPARALREE